MKITATEPVERQFTIQLNAQELADLIAICGGIVGQNDGTVRSTTDAIWDAANKVFGQTVNMDFEVFKTTPFALQRPAELKRVADALRGTRIPNDD